MDAINLFPICMGISEYSHLDSHQNSATKINFTLLIENNAYKHTYMHTIINKERNGALVQKKRKQKTKPYHFTKWKLGCICNLCTSVRLLCVFHTHTYIVHFGVCFFMIFMYSEYKCREVWWILFAKKNLNVRSPQIHTHLPLQFVSFASVRDAFHS